MIGHAGQTRAHRGLFAAFALLCLSFGASAQSGQVQQRVVGKLITQDDLAAIDARIRVLELVLANQDKARDSELRALADRVAALENQLAQSNAPKPSSTDGWSSIRRGMAKREVRDLLGEPMKLVDGALTHWFYSEDGYAGPHVAFRDGRVFDWSPPQR